MQPVRSSRLTLQSPAAQPLPDVSFRVLPRASHTLFAPPRAKGDSDKPCEIGKLSKPSYRRLRQQGKTPVAYKMGTRLSFKWGDAGTLPVNVLLVHIDPPRPAPQSGARFKNTVVTR